MGQIKGQRRQKISLRRFLADTREVPHMGRLANDLMVLGRVRMHRSSVTIGIPKLVPNGARLQN